MSANSKRNGRLVLGTIRAADPAALTLGVIDRFYAILVIPGEMDRKQFRVE